MKTAIITGASSGLGREFALRAVTEFPDIDCFWLVARREEKLAELAAEITDKKVACVCIDLLTDEGMDAYKELLSRENPQVELLVNNAGRGMLGEFAEEPLEGQLQMVDLNIRALTAVVSMTLPYMQDGSCLIQISSIASFAPTPRMTVYSATKAYVSFFSRGLHEELRPRGITVTAVCPPPMRTEFLQNANINGNSRAFEVLPYGEPDQVAIGALRAAKAGKAVYTPRLLYKFYRVLAAVLPHALIVKFSKT